MTKTEFRKIISFRIPEGLHTEFKTAAARERLTMNEILLRLVRAWLKNPAIIKG